MLIHLKLFYYQLRSITRWLYAYLCINMRIGFVLHIVKTPAGSPPLRSHPGASAQTAGMNKLGGTKQTAGTKKPAEHPVRGLKPVHHL